MTKTIAAAAVAATMAVSMGACAAQTNPFGLVYQNAITKNETRQGQYSSGNV